MLTIFLVSCGGASGSVPSNPEPFNPVNLYGAWNVDIKMSECESLFSSVYYFENSYDDQIESLISLGDEPDINNIAACNPATVPNVTELLPYTNKSSSVQFREIFGLRLKWGFDSIEILSSETDVITLIRTIKIDGIGDRERSR